MVSLGENSKQEVEQHTREATSENGPGDVEEERPSESKDGASEKGSKKTEEETRETGVDLHVGGSAAFLTVSQWSPARSRRDIGEDSRSFTLGLDPHSFFLYRRFAFSDLLSLYLLRCWRKFGHHLSVLVVGYV